jgi:hypothetical protein
LLIVEGLSLHYHLTEESLAEAELLPDGFHEEPVKTFIECLDGKNLVDLLRDVGDDRLLVDVFDDFFAFCYVEEVQFADLRRVRKQHQTLHVFYKSDVNELV